MNKNPYLILKEMMLSAPIHGPIHHYLDGAAFLTALHHAGVDFDLNAALTELRARSEQMPGATCGKWGVCGSASSLGAALSILHGTGPLSQDSFYSDNLALTSRILAREAVLGGPRCCKRNGFTAIEIATDFVKETYGIKLEKCDIICEFSDKNPTCMGAKCPYHGKE